eukprot:364479-Chlamydomonas_euryale.AAC.12
MFHACCNMHAAEETLEPPVGCLACGPGSAGDQENAIMGAHLQMLCKFGMLGKWLKASTRMHGQFRCPTQ